MAITIKFDRIVVKYKTQCTRLKISKNKFVSSFQYRMSKHTKKKQIRTGFIIKRMSKSVHVTFFMFGHGLQVLLCIARMNHVIDNFVSIGQKLGHTFGE